MAAEACRICRGEATKRCGKCQQEYYCGKEHQEQDWSSHKLLCRPYKGDSTKGAGKMGPTAPVLSVFKCAVCTEVVRTPFKLCQQGHLVCKKCMKKLSRCPCCRTKRSTDVPSSKDSPAGVKSQVEAVPGTCCYAGNGCVEMVDLGHKVEHGVHEKFCGFRPFLDTFESSPGKQLLVRDLKEFHSSRGERYSHNENKLLMVYSLHPSATSSLSCRCISKLCLFIVPIFAYDTFCLLSLFRYEPDSTFVMVFVAFFIGPPEMDVFIRVTFEKENNKSTFTLKASQDCEDGKLDKGSVANVNCSRIDKFMTNLTLNLGYEVFNKPK